MFAVFAGLAAGLLHVFSGPDHLAAVAPLASDSDRRRWRIGMQWGVGHTFGVLLIAGSLLLLRERLPLEFISAYSERLVGLALIAVGSWGIWKAKRAQPHAHAGASFAMGVLHGLAGSSHLFGVTPALAFSERMDAVGYLAGFGIGAIAAMSAFAAGVGVVSLRLEGRVHRHALLYASSGIALVVGGFWFVGL